MLFGGEFAVCWHSAEARDATRDLSQEIHALDKLRGGVSYNAVALSSPSVSQRYICSKVCPGRNTYKTRCVLVG